MAYPQAYLDSLNGGVNNFGNWDNWLQQNYQPTQAPATYSPTGGSTALSGIAGQDYLPGGTGTGAIFNDGRTAGYDQLNALHQGAQNDANMYAWGGSLLNGGDFTPQAMTNIDMSGNGSISGPGSPGGMFGAPTAGGGHGGDVRGGGRGAGGGYGMGSNPYLGAQADAIRAQQQQLLGQSLNSINSQAVGAGGLGGSRQGVAQGVAMGQAATGLDSALANLYGSNWNQDQNRNLQQYGMDQNYALGQGGLQLGNRNTDLSQTQLGASLWNAGNAAEWSPYTNYNNILGTYAGNGTTTGTTSGGGGALGLLGGALGGAQLANNFGWWK